MRLLSQDHVKVKREITLLTFQIIGLRQIRKLRPHPKSEKNSWKSLTALAVLSALTARLDLFGWDTTLPYLLSLRYKRRIWRQKYFPSIECQVWYGIDYYLLVYVIEKKGVFISQLLHNYHDVTRDGGYTTLGIEFGTQQSGYHVAK